MKSFFQGKTVLITGATSGIGRDLALYLANLGSNLILVGRREQLLEEVKGLCQAAGVQVMLGICDVVNRTEMELLRDRALAQFGLVDIVIANAGVGGLNPADNFSCEVHQKTMEINILGLINTLVPYIPSMIEKRTGHLVGVSSLAAFRGLPNAASYSSSKAAQATILESFRVDLRKYNIAVSSIHPGFVETAMTNHQEFKMPFKISARHSTKLILNALMKKKPVFLYPWQMRLLTYVNRLLPICIYDRLVPRLTGQRPKIAPRIF